MPVLRLRLALWFGAGVAVVLLWGCFLVYEVGYGTGICEDYTYGNGGPNDALDRWCNGESWRGWLTACLCFAAVSLIAGRVAAERWDWRAIVAGAALACVAVWAGFGLPQVLA